MVNKIMHAIFNDVVAAWKGGVKAVDGKELHSIYFYTMNSPL